MKIGERLKGEITGIQPYGAFVSLENGNSGLVHISEIKTGYIDNIHRLLSLGQTVEVQVIDYDEFTGKASLSMRSLEEERQHSMRRHRFSNNKHRTGFAPLKKALPVWTEETLTYLKEEEG